VQLPGAPFPAVRVGGKTWPLQRRRRGRQRPTVKPCAGLMKEIQSARGLAQSKTLRVIRSSSENAPASWTAAALRRFSSATGFTLATKDCRIPV